MQDTSVTIEFLASQARSLPLASQQALAFTANDAAKYLNSHTVAGLNAERAAIMAAGRLEWVLQHARQSISGVFAVHEMATLMDCYSGTLFFPAQILDMAGDVLDHLGEDLADDDEGNGGSLPNEVAKVRKLTPLQRLALADALEQAWHLGHKAGQDWEAVFAQLGIELL